MAEINLNVTSEIHDEFSYKTQMKPNIEGNVISEFVFDMKRDGNTTEVDNKDKEVIYIEHSPKTNVTLVGLQVWRGALLLGDYLIHLGLKGELTGKTVMELGTGTGLSGIVASKFAKKVIATDKEDEGLLDIVKLNTKHNRKHVKSEFKLMPLDFTKPWSTELTNAIKDTDIFIAADVIYDDDITAAFVSTLQKILNTNPPKTFYLSVEQRYIFHLVHCYDTFMTIWDKVKGSNTEAKWTADLMDVDFPQRFVYNRKKELVLWRFTSAPK